MNNKFEFNPLQNREVKKQEIATELFFGNKLRLAREAVGLSRPQFAEKLGLKSPSSIKTWESGDTFPEEFRLRSIAELCGLNVDDLTRWFTASKNERERFSDAKRYSGTKAKIVDQEAEVYFRGSTGGIRGHYKTAKQI